MLDGEHSVVHKVPGEGGKRAQMLMERPGLSSFNTDARRLPAGRLHFLPQWSVRLQCDAQGVCGPLLLQPAPARAPRPWADAARHNVKQQELQRQQPVDKQQFGEDRPTLWSFSITAPVLLQQLRQLAAQRRLLQGVLLQLQHTNSIHLEQCRRPDAAAARRTSSMSGAMPCCTFGSITQVSKELKSSAFAQARTSTLNRVSESRVY